MNTSLAELACGREHYTYADYCRLPEGAPYQLIGGELVMTPSPTPYHQIVLANLWRKMDGFVYGSGMGKILCAPLDVYLTETDTYQPDLIFIARDRLNIIEKARVNGAPDLVVEILSPGTAYYDLRKKYKVYEAQGVREYWIVDPEDKSVQVFVAREGKFVLDQEVQGSGEVKSHVLTGFSIDVQTIFEE
jgi:Uma2 family endonuclease